MRFRNLFGLGFGCGAVMGLWVAAAIGGEPVGVASAVRQGVRQGTGLNGAARIRLSANSYRHTLAAPGISRYSLERINEIVHSFRAADHVPVPCYGSRAR